MTIEGTKRFERKLMRIVKGEHGRDLTFAEIIGCLQLCVYALEHQCAAVSVQKRKEREDETYPSDEIQPPE